MKVAESVSASTAHLLMEGSRSCHVAAPKRCEQRAPQEPVKAAISLYWGLLFLISFFLRTQDEHSQGTLTGWAPATGLCHASVGTRRSVQGDGGSLG